MVASISGVQADLFLAFSDDAVNRGLARPETAADRVVEHVGVAHSLSPTGDPVFDAVVCIDPGN